MKPNIPNIDQTTAWRDVRVQLKASYPSRGETVPKLVCDFGVNFPHSRRTCHAIPSSLPGNKGNTQPSMNLDSTLTLPSLRKSHVYRGPSHHATRFLLLTALVHGMFSLGSCEKAFMSVWLIMATRLAPLGSRSRTLWRCGLMAGLISTLFGGSQAQVTTSPTFLTTATTPTVNRLTASTTYTPTDIWTPAPTCSAGSSAVGGYGGGVYLDGYGTYWSVACGYDFDGQTFYDGPGYTYVSWLA